MSRTQILYRRVAGSEAGKWQESEDGAAFIQYGRLVLEEGGDRSACAERMLRENQLGGGSRRGTRKARSKPGQGEEKTVKKNFCDRMPGNILKGRG